MKILVCTDGSEYSKKALQQAIEIADGCKVNEVTILHVYDTKITNILSYSSEIITPDLINQYQQMLEEDKKKKEKMLLEAKKIFQDKKIKARTIFKEGIPSETIIQVAKEEEVDLIVIGSRGLGGLKKVLLGSVSNSVIQEAENCSVLIVK